MTPKQRRTVRYGREAEHIIGHVLQKDYHTPNERGYCTQCLGMLIGAMEAAHKAGRKANMRKDRK